MPLDGAEDPAAFPRRILLVAAGLTPQVITETLYYLCRVRTPAFVPTEVHVVTTTTGKESVELMLLHQPEGQFWRFLREFDLDGAITFDRNFIHIISGDDGQALDDVRTEADNAATADFITNLVRTLTSDGQSAVYASISGGRNTMAFYLGYALTLFGRVQDRLSHVLVSEPFMRNQGFYFPPVQPKPIIGGDNRPVSTAQAVITLAEIPFVRLRQGLHEHLLTGRLTYTEAVDAVNRRYGPARLVVCLGTRSIKCGDVVINMPPQPLAFYSWLARRRRECADKGGHVNWRDRGIELGFLAEYRSVVGPFSHDYEAAAKLLASGMEEDFFNEKKSRVNRWLREELGPAAEPYLISASGKRPLRRFGLTLPVDAIAFSCNA